MKKKLLTVALAATMAVGSTFSAFAAEPALSYNFDDTSKITVKGSASVVANPDDANDKVLCIETGAGGMNGNYATIDLSEISSIDFSKGFTISMNVRPTANASDWNYLFGIGTNGSNGEAWSYIDGTIGFIARHGDPYVAHFPNDGWVDGNSANSAYDYFTKEENANKWYKVTYVFSKTEVAIYVNGAATNKWSVTDGSLDAVLASLKNGNSFNLGCGIDPNLENIGGYIDDVMIYNSALSAADVAAIPSEVTSSNNGGGETPTPDAGGSGETDAQPTSEAAKTGDGASTTALVILAAVACGAVVLSKKNRVTE